MRMNLSAHAMSLPGNNMKTFFVLLIGVVLGAVGWNYYEHSQNPNLADRARHAADQTRETASEAGDKVAGKAEDWKLTPDSIKDELARTGEVVRSKAKIVGEKMDDARIVAVIKGKYVVEKNLSALAISVECTDGDVKLAGSVDSADRIALAVTLALQTSGVHNVISRLTVKD
jgi:osmotically-inducible protein OsmY